MLPLALVVRTFFNKTPRFTRVDTCLERGEHGRLMSALQQDSSEGQHDEDEGRDSSNAAQRALARIPSLSSASAKYRSQDAAGEDTTPDRPPTVKEDSWASFRQVTNQSSRSFVSARSTQESVSPLAPHPIKISPAVQPISFSLSSLSLSLSLC